MLNNIEINQIIFKKYFLKKNIEMNAKHVNELAYSWLNFVTLSAGLKNRKRNSDRRPKRKAEERMNWKSLPENIIIIFSHKSHPRNIWKGLGRCESTLRYSWFQLFTKKRAQRASLCSKNFSVSRYMLLLITKTNL